MTFIPEDEARRRLRSPANVLSNRTDLKQKLPEVDLSELFLPIDLDSLISSVKSPSKSEESEESEKSTKKATEGEVPLPPQNSHVPLDKQDEYFDPFSPLKEARKADAGLNLRGRKPGIRDRTIDENAAVGLSSLLLGGTASEEMFGVPQTQQSIIMRGYVGSVDKAAGRAPKDELLESIYRHGKKASDLAFKKLFTSLDLLTEDKLKNVNKAKDLSQIAVNMSRIVQSVTPKDSGPEQGGVHFHIYGPEENRIEDYDTVEVRPDGSVIFEPGSESPSSNGGQ